jgi:hypothetical protein
MRKSKTTKIKRIVIYFIFLDKQSTVALNICANLKHNLDVVKENEYYSKFFRGLLQSAIQPNKVNHTVAANLLGVHCNSLRNAEQTYFQRFFLKSKQRRLNYLPISIDKTPPPMCHLQLGQL